MLRYLGTIAAVSTTLNNRTTGAPFVIPPGTTGLYLLTTASDVVVEVKADPTGTAVTTSNGFPLSSGQALPVECIPTSTACVAAISPVGANLKVYAIVAAS